RDRYFRNAEAMLGGREPRKASEMLWGAVAQGVKALAASRSLSIQTHGGLFEFMRRTSKELDCEELYDSLMELQVLHRNFYDEAVPATTLPRFFGKAREFLRELEELSSQMP
ncbi:MAG: PaREP1 family protein, partial [Thermoplasmata archaeon]